MSEPAEERWSIGGPVRSTRATLRLSGDDLDPASVTAALQTQPAFAVRKGEIWHTPRGSAHVAKEGRWMLRTEMATPGDLDAQIAKLLAECTDDLDTWRELAERFSANLLCGLFMNDWNQGVELSAKVLLMLGARGIRLGLDVYAAGPDDDTPGPPP